MPVEEITTERQRRLVEALEAIDTATLQAVARATGFGERTLWRYRAGDAIPSSRALPLERALGLSSRARDAA